jgi:hypothetical protein
MAIKGVIRGLGDHYADGTERLEIHFYKAAGDQGLPTKDRQRVPVPLIVDGQKYEAGLRSTPDCPYDWICPNMRGVKLAHVLLNGGFAKNEPVELHLSSEGYTVRQCAC